MQSCSCTFRVGEGGEGPSREKSGDGSQVRGGRYCGGGASGGPGCEDVGGGGTSFTGARLASRALPHHGLTRMQGRSRQRVWQRVTDSGSGRRGGEQRSCPGELPHARSQQARREGVRSQPRLYTATSSGTDEVESTCTAAGLQRRLQQQRNGRGGRGESRPCGARRRGSLRDSTSMVGLASRRLYLVEPVERACGCG